MLFGMPFQEPKAVVTWGSRPQVQAPAEVIQELQDEGAGSGLGWGVVRLIGDSRGLMWMKMPPFFWGGVEMGMKMLVSISLAICHYLGEAPQLIYQGFFIRG